jgi:ABC-type transporter Mla subunit MlaD
MDGQPKSFSSQPASPSTGANSEAHNKANEALQMAKQTAQEVGTRAKEAMGEISSQATGTVKDVLNNQVRAGADLAGNVAQSINLAADNLSHSSPQLAELSRTAAHKIESFSTELRAKSADELFQEASDLARRQPAAVFGAAALLGFALFRMLKAGARQGQGGSGLGPEQWSPDRRPQDTWQTQDAWRNRQFAGTGQVGQPGSKPSSPYGS